MAELSQLEQVKLDAQRLTLKRIQEQKDAKAWQESKDGPVTLDESVEAAKVEEPKAVKTKKGK